ncbi:MAG: hypothetical protein NW208_17400 [Bryobacter sp.]|nr:hypothetical protein [Bryobacter sp.]
MPPVATAYLRPMRGGSQTHLLGASDGHHYVVKLANNPQGRRVLVNEYLAWRILEYLKIPAQPASLIDIPADFLAATNTPEPRLGITLGRSFTPPLPGFHFGSRFPGSPLTTLVHDVIAENSLPMCRNLEHFWAILLFDKWTANSDSRQSVFFRALLADIKPEDPAARGLITSFIDHGFCFNGPYWDFPDRPLAGLYHLRRVYLQVRGWAQFEPWLERIRSFPARVLDEAIREMPQTWFDEADLNHLPRLCETLLRRREKVPRLIEDLKDRHPDTFPYWS